MWVRNEGIVDFTFCGKSESSYFEEKGKINQSVTSGQGLNTLYVTLYVTHCEAQLSGI